MAFMANAELYYQPMNPNQLLYWNGIARTNYLADSYYYDSDSDSEGIPGDVLSELVKAKNQNESPSATSPSQFCKFFQRGSCRYGDECRFVHTYPECVFFMKGNCRYGENCHFRHTGNKDQIFIEAKPRVSEKTPSTARTNSIFSPSDEDLKAGRLTRVKLCFDFPVHCSVKLEKPSKLSCPYFIDVFVDKRDDDVQYLHDIVEKKAEHPLYRKGMFDFFKHGTNLDLSDTSKKLKDTSIFIFGNNVDVLLNQSFCLAATVLCNVEMTDKGRYSMSELPRKEDGSFQEHDLRSLLKVFPKPKPMEADANANHVVSKKVDSSEPAKLHKMAENVGNRIRVHSKSECCWCSEKGCNCLTAANEEVESDDSELSSQSSDTRRRNSSTRNKLECGAYPNRLLAENIPMGTALKFGDIVTFGEYPSLVAYIVDDFGVLTKLPLEDGFITVPSRVSCQFKDPIQKYESIFKDSSSHIGDLMGIYVQHDDALFMSIFGNKLPADWKCCFVAKCGSAASLLSVDHFRIEVDQINSFTAVLPNVELSLEDISHVNCIEDVYQRGQSLKESDNFAEFEIELAVKKQEMASLIKKHGRLYPKIPTWFASFPYAKGRQGSCSVVVNWKGPREDEDVVKAIIEEFYEGCTWRYQRNASAVDPSSA